MAHPKIDLPSKPPRVNYEVARRNFCMCLRPIDPKLPDNREWDTAEVDIIAHALLQILAAEKFSVNLDEHFGYSIVCRTGLMFGSIADRTGSQHRTVPKSRKSSDAWNARDMRFLEALVYQWVPQ